MSADLIKYMIEGAILIFSLAGVYYTVKNKVENNTKYIKDLKTVLDGHSIDTRKIHEELYNCKVTDEKVKGLYKILDSISVKSEKNYDQMSAMIIKIFETKADKK